MTSSVRSRIDPVPGKRRKRYRSLLEQRSNGPVLKQDSEIGLKAVQLAGCSGVRFAPNLESHQPCAEPSRDLVLGRRAADRRSRLAAEGNQFGAANLLMGPPNEIGEHSPNTPRARGAEIG